MRVLVIGGSGTISRHTVHYLGEQAQVEVALFNRGRRGAESNLFVGDRADFDALAEALAAFRPDVVVDFVCFDTAALHGLLDRLPTSVSQYVFVSTVDAMGYPFCSLPAGEGAQGERVVSSYAERKRACEIAVLAWAEETGRGVTIVRPTYSFGPRFLISVFDRNAAELIWRLKNGQVVALPNEGNGWLHASDALDTGRMIGHLLGDQRAFGQTFLVGTPGGWLTHRAYVERIANFLDVGPKFRFVPAARLLADSALPADNLFFELTQFDLQFDLSRFRSLCPEFVSMSNLDFAVAAYVKALSGSPAPSEGIEAMIAQIGG